MVYASVAAACSGADSDSKETFDDVRRRFLCHNLGVGGSATESCGRVQRCMCLGIPQRKALLTKPFLAPDVCHEDETRQGAQKLL